MVMRKEYDVIMRYYLKKMKYYYCSYLFLFLFYFFAYAFIFISFGLYIDSISKQKGFYSYLDDNFVYCSDFDYEEYVKENVFEGVLFNLNIEDDIYIYEFVGDYVKYGIPYSIDEIIMVNKIDNISDNGIIIDYDTYINNDCLNTISIGNTIYSIKDVLHLSFPKSSSLYVEKTININLALMESDGSYSVYDYAIFDYYDQSINYASSYFVGRDYKKECDAFVQSFINVINIALVIPIIIMLIVMIFIYEFISKKIIKDIKIKVLLGAKKSYVFQNVFFDLFFISTISLFLVYTLILPFKNLFPLLCCLLIYNTLLVLVFSLIVMRKISRKEKNLLCLS